MNQREFQNQDSHRKLREGIQLEIIELGKLKAFKNEVGIAALKKVETMDLSEYANSATKVSDIVDMLIQGVL